MSRPNFSFSDSRISAAREQQPGALRERRPAVTAEGVGGALEPGSSSGPESGVKVRTVWPVAGLMLAMVMAQVRLSWASRQRARLQDQAYYPSRRNLKACA